jgi:hypothetical protein
LSTIRELTREARTNLALLGGVTVAGIKALLVH